MEADHGFKEPIPEGVAQVHYFSFGANMSLPSLENRGVLSLGHKRAVLLNHRLVFNVRAAVDLEGKSGYGNVVEAEGESVHGVIHLLSAEHMLVLDSVESPGYDRVFCFVETYEGERIQAMVYKQTRSFPIFRLDDSCLPSWRYIRLLHHAASAAGLPESWIEFLKAHPQTEPRPLVVTPEIVAQLNARKWTCDEAVANEGTVIYGMVLKSPEGQPHPLPPTMQKLLLGDCSLKVCGMVSFDPKPCKIEDATQDQTLFMRSILRGLIESGMEVVGHCEPCWILSWAESS